jgi:hypothetical protein
MKASATDSLGYYELKQHMAWLDEQCSKLLDQRKQAKLQCLQNQSQTNERNSKNKNIRNLHRGVNEFKKG